MSFELEIVAETDFKACSAAVAFHFQLLAGLGFLMEYDVLVQQVGQLQFQVEVLVQLIGSYEVERMQRILLFIAQSGDTYGVDAFALQVVEQCGGELRVVLKVGA